MDFLSVSSLQKNIWDKKISAQELFDFYLKKIKKHNKQLNAFISLNEQALFKKKEGRLSGIPIGVKDLFLVEGMKSTAGSKMLEHYKAPFTATAIKKLEDEGAIIIGKCNNDEFGMGSTGENSYFGPAKNPWDLKRTAGGSSSGSASAVSAGLCPVSIGTDTGGSVRLPAHYCHLVGFKPSYGRISRYGMIAYASSLDQAGVFTHKVEDSALLVDVMSGFDEKDSTSLQEKPTSFREKLNADIKNKKLAYFDLTDFSDQIDPEVISAFKKSLEVLKERGCELIEKKPPFLDYGLSVYYLISTAEASSNLSRYDGVRYGYQSQNPAQHLQDFYALNRSEAFGKEVKRRILMGSFSLSSGYYEEYFHKACQVRRLIKEKFDEIFKTCSAIVLPSASSTAPLLGSQKDPLKTYLNDIFTVSANLIGSPALSLPFAFSKDRLPIGIQLVGPALEEQNILDIALALEQETEIYKKRPKGYE